MSSLYRAALTLVLVLASGAATASAANLDLNPNPAHANSGVGMSGCGYLASKQVSVTVYTPEAVVFFYTNADAAGCVVPSTFWPTMAGGYSFEARQSARAKKQSVMATSFLEVIE
jgi:hypothetical protein